MRFKLLAVAALSATSMAAWADTMYIVNPPAQVVVPASPAPVVTSDGQPVYSSSSAMPSSSYLVGSPVIVQTVPGTVAYDPNTMNGGSVNKRLGESGPGPVDKTTPWDNGPRLTPDDVGTSSAGSN